MGFKIRLLVTVKIKKTLLKVVSLDCETLKKRKAALVRSSTPGPVCFVTRL